MLQSILSALTLIALIILSTALAAAISPEIAVFWIIVGLPLFINKMVTAIK